MKAPKTNSPKVLAPQGTHVARVVGLIYIGTITTEYKGEKKELYKIRLTWELPTETHQFRADERPLPFVVSKEFTFSMGKKSNLRPIVEGIIGTSLTDEEAYNFDIEDILSKPCLLAISHAEGEMGKYVIINSATGLIKGLECPPQVNQTKVLSYLDWNQEYFDSLPDFIKEKMRGSKEYKLKEKLDPLRTPTEDDGANLNEIPF